MDLINNTYVGRVTKPVELKYDKENDRHFAYVKFVVNMAKPRFYEALVVRDSAKACAEYLKVGKEIGVTAFDEEPKSYVVNNELKHSISLYQTRIFFGKDPYSNAADNKVVVPEEDVIQAAQIPDGESSLETDPIPF